MTASASRLGPRFAALQAAPRAALVSFVTAGDPSPEHTVPAMHALVKGGTDILELGIPFSDPEAEGPAIQASSERALAQGMTLKQVLDLVATFRLVKVRYVWGKRRANLDTGTNQQLLYGDTSRAFTVGPRDRDDFCRRRGEV